MNQARIISAVFKVGDTKITFPTHTNGERLKQCHAILDQPPGKITIFEDGERVAVFRAQTFFVPCGQETGLCFRGKWGRLNCTLTISRMDDGGDRVLSQSSNAIIEPYHQPRRK